MIRDVVACQISAYYIAVRRTNDRSELFSYFDIDDVVGSGQHSLEGDAPILRQLPRRMTFVCPQGGANSFDFRTI